MSKFDQLFFSLLTREIIAYLGRKGGGTVCNLIEIWPTYA